MVTKKARPKVEYDPGDDPTWDDMSFEASAERGRKMREADMKRFGASDDPGYDFEGRDNSYI